MTDLLTAFFGDSPFFFDRLHFSFQPLHLVQAERDFVDIIQGMFTFEQPLKTPSGWGRNSLTLFPASCLSSSECTSAMDLILTFFITLPPFFFPPTSHFSFFSSSFSSSSSSSSPPFASSYAPPPPFFISSLGRTVLMELWHLGWRLSPCDLSPLYSPA
jgi:hypothetical protein